MNAASSVMNNVTQCSVANASSRCSSASGTAKTSMPASNVGGSCRAPPSPSRTGDASRRCSRQKRHLALEALPLQQLPLPARKVLVLQFERRQTGRYDPRGRHRRGAPARPENAERDQPSKAMWWMMKSSRCSRSAQRKRVSRKSGPRSKSKCLCASSVLQHRITSRRCKGCKASRSTTGRSIGMRGQHNLESLPCSSRKHVRSTSCRPTISCNARRRRSLVEIAIEKRTSIGIVEATEPASACRPAQNRS